MNLSHGQIAIAIRITICLLIVIGILYIIKTHFHNIKELILNDIDKLNPLIIAQVESISNVMLDQIKEASNKTTKGLQNIVNNLEGGLGGSINKMNGMLSNTMGNSQVSITTLPQYMDKFVGGKVAEVNSMFNGKLNDAMNFFHSKELDVNKSIYSATSNTINDIDEATTKIITSVQSMPQIVDSIVKNQENKLISSVNDTVCKARTQISGVGPIIGGKVNVAQDAVQNQIQVWYDKFKSSGIGKVTGVLTSIANAFSSW